jgi:serine/threonine protein kinase
MNGNESQLSTRKVRFKSSFSALKMMALDEIHWRIYSLNDSLWLMILHRHSNTYMPMNWYTGTFVHKTHNCTDSIFCMFFEVSLSLTFCVSQPFFHSDLKPQNIGFDIRGHVKVFDFGLAKPLKADQHVAEGLYNMTGMCGSIPYMAPEVALRRPYNEKSDVFSFGILLHSILSLKAPFPNIRTRADFVNKVAKGKGRPTIKRSWPLLTRNVLQQSWMVSPHDRPTMETICNTITDEVGALTHGDMIRVRKEQFMNVSLHSLYNASKEFTLEKSSQHPPKIVTTF